MSQALDLLVFAAFILFCGSGLSSIIFANFDFDKKDIVRAFVVLLGLSGGLMSAILELMLVFLPGKENSFYLVGIATPFFILALLSNRDGRKYTGFALKELFLRRLLPFHFSGHYRFSNIMLSLFLWGLIIMVALEAFVVPLMANDPLEYASTARIIYEHKSSDVYPMVDLESSSGYYGPWSHPLGYINLMVITFMLQGTADISGLSKFVTPTYFVFTLLLLVTFFNGNRLKTAGLISAFLLATTPAYISGVMDSHIDPFRMFGFFSCFVMLREYLKTHSKGYFLLTLLCIWLGLYSHSLGILIVPILCWILFLQFVVVIQNSDKFIKEKICSYFALILLPICFNIPRYLTNISVFGSPIADASAVPLWQVGSLEYEYYFQVVRGVFDAQDRILFGIFKVFTGIDSFGPVYWLAAIGFFWQLKQRQFAMVRLKAGIREMFRSPSEHVLVWSVVCYLGMVVLSVVLGIDSFIKNYRYIMTIQPLVALLAAKLILTNVLIVVKRLERANNEL